MTPLNQRKSRRSRLSAWPLVPVLLGSALIALLCVAPPGVAIAAGPDQQTTFSSVEERRLFDQIEQERKKLQNERQDLDLKKKELKSINDSVDKKLAALDNKISELKAVQKKLESLLTAKSAAEKKRTQDLAQIYARMSPARAAQALSGLDPTLAADLLGAMKARAAAKILDQISKQKATQLSTTFSTIKIE